MKDSTRLLKHQFIGRLISLFEISLFNLDFNWFKLSTYAEIQLYFTKRLHCYGSISMLISWVWSVTGYPDLKVSFSSCLGWTFFLDTRHFVKNKSTLCIIRATESVMRWSNPFHVVHNIGKVLFKQLISSLRNSFNNINHSLTGRVANQEEVVSSKMVYSSLGTAKKA